MDILNNLVDGNALDLRKMAKSLKLYTLGSLFLAAVWYIFSSYGNALFPQKYYIDTTEYIIKFRYFRFFLISMLILIENLLFYRFSQNCKSLSQLEEDGSEILKLINKVFIISFLLLIGALIVEFFNLRWILNYYREVDYFTNYNPEFSENNSLQNRNMWNLVVESIPSVLMLFLYYNFNKWAKIISYKLNYNIRRLDLPKTTNLIFYGAIIRFGSNLLSVISYYSGSRSFIRSIESFIYYIGAIIFYVGLFQTYKILNQVYNKMKPGVEKYSENFFDSKSSATLLPNYILRSMVNSNTKKTASVRSTPQICPNCGNFHERNDKFCGKCGYNYS